MKEDGIQKWACGDADSKQEGRTMATKVRMSKSDVTSHMVIHTGARQRSNKGRKSRAVKLVMFVSRERLEKQLNLGVIAPRLASYSV